MRSKSWFLRLLYAARDLRSRALLAALRARSKGAVLDVGGWDYVTTAIAKAVPFESWTVLEPTLGRAWERPDPRVRMVRGDGCAIGFASASFDTVLCIQVLEHVHEPGVMVAEIARVLRPGGTAILLVPQTSNMHLAPHWHANLSRFWLEQALPRAGLEIDELRPLGGFWSTIASRLVYFFFHSARVEGMSVPEYRRNAFFFVLWPLMALYALASIPVCLLFSLGDLSEEPNNHLVVARKRPVAG